MGQWDLITFHPACASFLPLRARQTWPCPLPPAPRKPVEVPPKLSLAQAAPWGLVSPRLSSQTGELQLGHPQRLGLRLSSQMERVKGRVGHPGWSSCFPSPSACWCVGCRDKGQKCSDSRSPKGRLTIFLSYGCHNKLSQI